MALNANLQIELHHSPRVVLAYDEDWGCPICGRHMAIVEGPEDNQMLSCPFCMIDKAGKDSIIIAGWRLTRGPNSHINASPLKP
jgi:hypothetical protein